MASFRVTLAEQDEAYDCRENESVLHGMARLGKKGIPLGCRGGGCGVCKVRVLSGEYSRQVMSRCHVSEAELEAGCVLACRTFPESDLEIAVIGKMSKNILAKREPSE
ncbi:2Fe-2S iron-sulfur cluster binding domain-containing protein [Amphritea atlantica]|uniref:2Fe-2S iron-sulfur cluster binding domain-containing protein n=1 Tax=Amphritea atlantica TaxID=355243 RepID=A0A1H9LAP4_9GAMM|nr:2Fe-2S iron-sulfur cluster binding domain-containing protein [Amphritea atlantica]SER08506.1 2Fe-2S iron-sulfur cluster binding domain-containing protein [Amphritea atlantica]